MEGKSVAPNAYTSAVVMMPPPEFWPPLQEIRKDHDRGFVRWPPHVTLLYPFVVDEYFAEAAVAFERALSSFSPFTVRLSTFKYFKHSKGYTVWLDPNDSATEGHPMKQLQALLEAEYPYCSEQSSKENGFTPHLTVGQSRTKNEMTEHKNKFQESWQSVEFEVREVYLISRTASDPFEVRAVIPFGPAKGADPHFPTFPIPVREKKAPSQVPEATAFVGNLPFSLDDAGLKALFTNYNVASAKVITKFGKRSKGFGFVEFNSAEEKDRAIKEMNDFEVGDRKIVVKNTNS